MCLLSDCARVESRWSFKDQIRRSVAAALAELTLCAALEGLGWPQPFADESWMRRDPQVHRKSQALIRWHSSPGSPPPIHRAPHLNYKLGSLQNGDLQSREKWILLVYRTRSHETYLPT